MTLRRTPGDFLVLERPDPGVVALFRPRPGSGHAAAVYQLTKTSLTTPEALPRLAKALGLSQADKAVLSYAGLKDKHAVTTQLVSVRVKGAEDRPWPEDLAGPAITARLAGFAAADADASWIDRNEFTLTVRDLSPGAVREMGRRAALLDLRDAGDLRTLLIPNYFGEQRFGSARHGEGFAARTLIKGDFETALRLLIATPARKDSGARREFTRLLAEKWGQWKACLRHMPKCPHRAPIEALAEGRSFADAFSALPYLDQEMAVEAYQSSLWNQTVADLLKPLDGAGEIATDYGPLTAVPAASVPAALRGCSMPTPAAGMTMEVPWAAAMESTLRREGLRQSDLRIPQLRRPSFDAVPRALFVRAEGFSMTRPDPDELSRPGRVKTTARFMLPPGAYATVVMRMLGQ